MSVSFLEPDIYKLRQQLQQSPRSNSPAFDSAISDDSDTDDRRFTSSGRLGLKPALIRSASSSAVQGSSSPKPPTFSAEATLNNTNSNSLLFKRRSSEDSPDIIFNSQVRKRSSSRRRIPTASSRSSSVARAPSKEPGKRRTSLPNSRRNSSAESASVKSRESEDIEVEVFDDDEDDNELIFEELEDTPFFKRVSFDTINIQYHDPPSTGFRFSRPSFSSVSMASWGSTEEDTFNSFSMSSKHEDFKASYGSRTFLCAISSVSTSWRALKWLVEKVMEDGDELLCLKVEKEATKKTEYYKNKAEEVLTQVVHTIVDCSVKRINVVVELCLGSVRHIVRQAVLLYQPAIVIVGTSLKQYQKVMRYMSKKNTLSNFFINHSPVPVIVVVQEMIDKHDKLHQIPKRTLGDIMDLLEKKKEESPGSQTPVVTISCDSETSSRNPSISLTTSQSSQATKDTTATSATSATEASLPQPQAKLKDDFNHIRSFSGSSPRSRSNSATRNYNYLSYLTSRANIEVDYNDDDVRQNYRSLFADYDENGNLIEQANSKNTNGHSAVNLGKKNTSETTATTISGSTTSYSDATSPVTPSSQKLNSSFQMNKAKRSDSAIDDEVDPKASNLSLPKVQTNTPPTTQIIVNPSDTPSSPSSLFAGSAPLSLARTVSNNTAAERANYHLTSSRSHGFLDPNSGFSSHLSTQKANSSTRSLSATPSAGAMEKPKRKKSFFGSFMRGRRSEAT